MAAQAPPGPAELLPTWEALEAAGARIGEIRVLNRDIFELSNPKENNALFRLANRLHIQTRPGVIERQLLIQTGEVVSARRIAEAERVLRSNRYLYDVQLRPVAWHDGVVDIEVLTRDTWTLDIGASLGRSGGANSSGWHLREYNLFGTGTSISLGQSSGVDRSGTELMFANQRAFGTQASINVSHAANSDGTRDHISLTRPFHELDARWTAGLLATNDDRIESVYNAGKIVSQYRRQEDQREVFGGWSPGLQDGWVQRFTAGLRVEQDGYRAEPGMIAPTLLPADSKLVSPFVRYELIEDRYEKELNRDLVGRPEYFALGLNARVQLGQASTSWGSTSNTWLYSGLISRGFRPSGEQTLLAAAHISGRYSDGQSQRQRIGAEVQYYVPQSRRWLFYAAGSTEGLTRPDPAQTLELGGDNGVRGYPLRYQSGTRRTLFTVEERFYTDIYLWQLFRIGGAAYFDIGRAWGGNNVNQLNPGWLRNVGMGLRIVSARAAFSNVLHIDLAFPIDATSDLKKLQFLVKTRTSF